MKRVLVIVVTYNGMRWLQRCLGSVPGDGRSEPAMTQTVTPGLTGGLVVDLYVWDNDSTDGSADFVAAHYPAVKLIRSADNLGFSKPNNEGFKYAMEKGYDYVYLLNQDAWLEEGALDKLVATADANPEFAILSPMQYQDGYEALDSQFEKALGRHGEGMCAQISGHPRPDKREGPIYGRGRSEAEAIWAHMPYSVPRIMAAHWLVRVSALERIGLFNEELFPFWGQDDDWCNRARFHGYRIGVVPEARAVHDRAQRDEPLERTVQRNYFAGSLVRLADINRPLWDALCYVFAFTFVKVFKYRSFLPLKYLRSIFSRLKEVREHRASSRMRALYTRNICL